jgi:serine/threonine-protein kinase
MSELLDCPDAECWRALLDVSLPAELCDRYQRHLDSCLACQGRLDETLPEQDEVLLLARRMGDPTARPADPALCRALEALRQMKSTASPAPAEPADLYFLRRTDRPDVLGMLGHYEVLEVIGQGGMGVVLKGYEPALRRFVAIKVLASALAGSSAARHRFTREAQSAAAVCHDHVVAVYGVAEADGLPYLVMQYVAGESLQARLDRSGPLPIEEVVRIGHQTALGLAAAHAQGVIHRDIKPANLLLQKDEGGEMRDEKRPDQSDCFFSSLIPHPSSLHVRITDFGLARATDDVGVTQSGVVAGTPQYMAPEQARGEPVDHRADLFSLGSVLYAACTGEPPFRGPTAMAVLRQVSEKEADPVRSVNPAVPDWLDALIARLLAREPGNRFQSAAEVAGLLERYQAHLASPDVPAPPLPSQSGARARGRRSWLPALLLLGALGGWAAFQLANGGDAPAAKPHPGAEYHEYYVPLTGRPGNLPQMRLVGPDAETCVRFEPEGVRVTLVRGYNGSRQVGLSTGIALKGDFEVTVSFEILELPRPEDAGPATALTLWLSRSRGTGDTRILGVSRRISSTGSAFRALMAWIDPEGKHHDTGQLVETEAKFGRLRVARRGAEVSCYVSEGPDGDFALIDQASVGDMELDDVQLVTMTHSPASHFDGRFRDLRIRTGTLPGVSETPNGARSRGWLTAAAVLGMILALLFGLTLFLRRRRSGADAQVRAPAAGSLSFACSCGKSLRAKADLAGKKVRCPGCGEPVQVPGGREGGSAGIRSE